MGLPDGQKVFRLSRLDTIPVYTDVDEAYLSETDTKTETEAFANPSEARPRPGGGAGPLDLETASGPRRRDRGHIPAGVHVTENKTSERAFFDGKDRASRALRG